MLTAGSTGEVGEVIALTPISFGCKVLAVTAKMCRISLVAVEVLVKVMLWIVLVALDALIVSPYWYNRGLVVEFSITLVVLNTRLIP